MLPYIRNGDDSLFECFLKTNHVDGLDTPFRSRFIIGNIFVMDKFESRDLPDLTIDRKTVWALLRFSALLVDFLAYLCPSQVINSRLS